MREGVRNNTAGGKQQAVNAHKQVYIHHYNQTTWSLIEQHSLLSRTLYNRVITNKTAYSKPKEYFIFITFRIKLYYPSCLAVLYLTCGSSCLFDICSLTDTGQLISDRIPRFREKTQLWLKSNHFFQRGKNTTNSFKSQYSRLTPLLHTELILTSAAIAITRSQCFTRK